MRRDCLGNVSILEAAMTEFTDKVKQKACNVIDIWSFIVQVLTSYYYFVCFFFSWHVEKWTEKKANCRQPHNMQLLCLAIYSVAWLSRVLCTVTVASCLQRRLCTAHGSRGKQILIVAQRCEASDDSRLKTRRSRSTNVSRFCFEWKQEKNAVMTRSSGSSIIFGSSRN